MGVPLEFFLVGVGFPYFLFFFAAVGERSVFDVPGEDTVDAEVSGEGAVSVVDGLGESLVEFVVVVFVDCFGCAVFHCEDDVFDVSFVVASVVVEFDFGAAEFFDHVEDLVSFVGHCGLLDWYYLWQGLGGCKTTMEVFMGPIVDWVGVSVVPLVPPLDSPVFVNPGKVLATGELPVYDENGAAIVGYKLPKQSNFVLAPVSPVGAVSSLTKDALYTNVNYALSPKLNVAGSSVSNTNVDPYQLID